MYPRLAEVATRLLSVELTKRARLLEGEEWGPKPFQEKGLHESEL